jgi:hypothetical protein
MFYAENKVGLIALLARSVDRLGNMRRSTECVGITLSLSDLLSEQGTEFSEHDIQPIDVRGMRQHLFQFC